MPAAYGATWQYCSYSRISIPLLKITFCFYTDSSGAVFVSTECLLLAVLGRSWSKQLKILLDGDYRPN